MINKVNSKFMLHSRLMAEKNKMKEAQVGETYSKCPDKYFPVCDRSANSF